VQVCRITPEELKRKLHQGANVQILDVRQPAAYASSPVETPNSRRIEPSQVEAAYRSLPQDVPTVTYCT